MPVEEVLLSQSLVTITYKSYGRSFASGVGCTHHVELARLPWTILTIYTRFTPDMEKEGSVIFTRP